ncbi:hypothetical protein JAAARDRAFT_661762 [Jaapia argillacea MUCL 33604]|uniref:Uncharacterized protein n=1 Tax=Jaapia argillacea MUCL 33604 TaxID=933084 RepID=A0A067PE24_9AGAM|nr:hypothetical protein JAAARDRAFT_661762 [Jaapia argillacea MUCL 33604]
MTQSLSLVAFIHRKAFRRPSTSRRLPTSFLYHDAFEPLYFAVANLSQMLAVSACSLNTDGEEAWEGIERRARRVVAVARCGFRLLCLGFSPCVSLGHATSNETHPILDLQSQVAPCRRLLRFHLAHINSDKPSQIPRTLCSRMRDIWGQEPRRKLCLRCSHKIDRCVTLLEDIESRSSLLCILRQMNVTTIQHEQPVRWSRYGPTKKRLSPLQSTRSYPWTRTSINVVSAPGIDKLLQQYRESTFTIGRGMFIFDPDEKWFQIHAREDVWWS